MRGQDVTVDERTSEWLPQGLPGEAVNLLDSRRITLEKAHFGGSHHPQRGGCPGGAFGDCRLRPQEVLPKAAVFRRDASAPPDQRRHLLHVRLFAVSRALIQDNVIRALLCGDGRTDRRDCRNLPSQKRREQILERRVTWSC